MHRRNLGRLLASLLLLGAGLGCTLATQGEPEIPMVSFPNTFVTAVSGELNGALDGTATIFPALGPVSRTVELTDSDDPTIRVVLSEGVLSSSTFDFAVGDYSLAGIPGIRDVDAVFYLSSAPGDDFIATSGSLEIIDSGPSIIRGRFSFTGTSLGPTLGFTARKVKVRGTFWAVPEVP